MLKKLNISFLDKKLGKKSVLELIVIAAVALLIFIAIAFPFLKKVFQPPAVLRTLEEKLKPGKVGEKTETPAPLPSIVSNTSGLIKRIQDNGLIVQGYGSNFADRESRILTVIFTDSTITKKIGAESSYQGFQGLKHLKKGMEISIKGAENLRGKTEFEAENIIFFSPK